MAKPYSQCNSKPVCVLSSPTSENEWNRTTATATEKKLIIRKIAVSGKNFEVNAGHFGYCQFHSEYINIGIARRYEFHSINIVSSFRI